MDIQSLIARLGGMKSVRGGDVVPMLEEEIVVIENELGFRLPEGYRAFLASYGASSFNGKSKDNPYVVYRSISNLPPHISNDDRGLFDAFYGGEANGRDPYSLRVRRAFYLGRMPEHLTPIGDDGGAGQICLGICGNYTGKIFYWDQQNEPLDAEAYLEDYGEPRPPEVMFQNIYKVADSFEDFLQSFELRDE